MTLYGEVFAKLRRATRLLQSRGVASLVREVGYRCFNEYYERRLNIRTSGYNSIASLGVSNPESFDYVPLGYRAIWAAFNLLPSSSQSGKFMDFGCGKGRVVAAAATMPFRGVIGIELSSELAEVSRRNVASMRKRKAQTIEILTADAAGVAIPDDVSVIFFFNPFSGSILRSVVANIQASLERSPRKIFIIYFNKRHFEETISDMHWIARVESGEFYPGFSFGLFVASQT